MEYQSYHSNLVKILSDAFKINWLTIKVGFIDLHVLLSQDVLKYAEHVFSHAELNEDSIELKLYSAYAYEEDEIKEYVTELSKRVVGCEEIELKKYIIIDLTCVLKRLPKDSMQACLGIGEMWGKYNFPQYMPMYEPQHGKQHFGSEEHLKELIESSQYWIKEQTSLINACQ